MRKTSHRKRILPFHYTNAGSSDGVIEWQTEKGSGRPAVGRVTLFFALGVLLTFSLGERSYRWGYRGAHVLGGLGLSSSIDCSLPRQDSLLGAVRLRSWSFTRNRESGASCIVCLWGEEKRGKKRIQSKKKKSSIHIIFKKQSCLPSIIKGIILVFPFECCVLFFTSSRVWWHNATRRATELCWVSVMQGCCCTTPNHISTLPYLCLQRESFSASLWLWKHVSLMA